MFTTQRRTLGRTITPRKAVIVSTVPFMRPQRRAARPRSAMTVPGASAKTTAEPVRTMGGSRDGYSVRSVPIGITMIVRPLKRDQNYLPILEERGMNRMILAFVGLLFPLVLMASPANAQTTARHYDCSKAGNANKAACKNAAAPAPAAAAKSSTTRHYDCSKAGNANKAACKGVAVPSAPATASATTSARHYDCSKAANANKAACKGLTHAAATPMQPPAPAVNRSAPSSHATVVGQNTNPGGPNGATAKCRDNTYSKSAHRSGTCSRHGGVAQWY